MFSGIVEEVGTVLAVHAEGSNRRMTVGARLAAGLKVDQSVAHNGVCLTVVGVHGDRYDVVAVEETLRRSNLGALGPGDGVNLERSLRLGDRLDGHMVQGHVDTTVPCIGRFERGGSWSFVLGLPEDPALLVPKGSICLNGVSLTIAALDAQSFTVAIIPYTFEHTTFKHLRPGDAVNVEYDVLGKYVRRMLEGR
jgi:riboflavin synthase